MIQVRVGPQNADALHQLNNKLMELKNDPVPSAVVGWRNCNHVDGDFRSLSFAQGPADNRLLIRLCDKATHSLNRRKVGNLAAVFLKRSG